MNSIQTFSRILLPCFVVLASLAYSATASAQYMWLDASGRKVFSDQPPPNSIPAKRILQQPGKAVSSIATDSNDTSDKAEKADMAADAQKSAAKTTPADKATANDKTKDKDLEAAKKKIEDEAAAKKKVEEDKRNAARADNCQRAKQAKATLDSGVRLMQTNAKGERGFMDDASRTVETKRLEGIMASDCKVN